MHSLQRYHRYMDTRLLSSSWNPTCRAKRPSKQQQGSWEEGWGLAQGQQPAWLYRRGSACLLP